VSTLDDLTRTSGPGGMAGFVTRLSQRLRPVRRRDVLVGATVAATALATKPKEYALRPVAAYDTICGPGNTASSGWTVFCATINKGVNTCPPGSFAAGWWKAADSSWCGGGYRYIVDCNASCSKCTSGCSDGICDSRCWSCACGTGSSATCDQRRVCCNAFRYGQCNTQVKCSGGVHCRVVSCVPPYKWASCTTTSLSDNRTAEHSSPRLPQWGPQEQKYRDMGAQGSFLKASASPVASVGDGRGSYVVYQGGSIYYTSQTGAHAVPNGVKALWASVGGPTGSILGYPTSDQATGLAGGGWVQTFEQGAIADSPSTAMKVVYGTAYSQWVGTGREGGELGYPRGNRVSGLRNGGWRQEFQKGVVTDSASTSTKTVYGTSHTVWTSLGREEGPLGYPRGNRVSGLPDGGWRQQFEGGVTTNCLSTLKSQAVYGDMYTAYSRFDLEAGVLGYPVRGLWQDSKGRSQGFQHGETWARGTTGLAYAVYGAVLAAWKDAGWASGRYGYPLTDTEPTGDGRLTCTFEGGTITA
jgi:uncharacterized protein with LGFP repeats